MAKSRPIKPQWYNTLHKWVQKHGNKPSACTRCGDSDRRLEWSNISGEYKRDLADFRALCSPCHAEVDGRKGTCKNGHNLDETAYYRPSGGRTCSLCKSAYRKRYRERYGV